MVCVSTSITLLKSVLSRAGSSIKSEFNKLSQSENKILLDGGSTLARKILFVTWQLEVRSSDTIKAQKVIKLILLTIIQILFFILVIIRFS
jgi:hypothetical protein